MVVSMHTGTWIQSFLVGGEVEVDQFPCLHDLDPLDFYFWGYLKSSVYSSPVDDEETLWNRIVEDFQTIHDMPGISDCL
jgi:hypothetical protein